MSEGARLPPTLVNKFDIECCKSLLENEKNTISYRSVLEDISEQQWFISASSPDSLEVTKKLIGLSPSLLEEFKKKVASESVVDRFMALVPFLGKLLASEKFLESLASTNQIILDLKSQRLISVKSVAPTVVIVGRPDGLLQVGYPAITISISELGKLLLASQPARI